MAIAATTFELLVRPRVICGVGAIERLGELTRELGGRRPLLVSDQGLVEAGHVDRVRQILAATGVDSVSFHDFGANPDTSMVERGATFASAHEIDAIIGVGGGSSLDCAKGINFLATNGGSMSDYKGHRATARPMLPMIAVPTTAGTGSEAQSYAVISDADTHMKMACGAPGAAFRVAVLDAELTVTQPAGVTAAAGFDAVAHAVETSVTTRRTPVSGLFSREAFRLLDEHLERVLATPDDLAARQAMQLGAFYAGLAIEHSMLGAAHACANPLTARYRMEHGVALAILLPQVVRWNAATTDDPYRAFVAEALPGVDDAHPGNRLATRLVEMTRAGGLPERLRDTNVAREDLAELAREAAEQWTGTFNPRRFGEAEALEVYQCSY